MSADTRVVFGATCSWWGDIGDVAVQPESGLPCCPQCRGLLYEMDSEERFLVLANDFEAAGNYEAAGGPGYVALMLWLKGKCFKSFDDAKSAYAREHAT